MSVKAKLLFGGLIFILLCGGVVFFYSPVHTAAATQKYRGGELLIKFKNDTHVNRIKVEPNADIFSIIRTYQSMPEIEYIEPNYVVTATAFPNDPDFAYQWYFSPINARNFWSQESLIREQKNITRQSVIAILDTGVFISHPDLKDKIWTNKKEIAGDGIDNDSNGYVDDVHGWNFVDNNNNPNPQLTGNYDPDAVKHGTLVAGIAAAESNNGQGIAGMSWSSLIMPLRVLDSAGAGDVYSVIQAINYAVANGADVINMSFVGSGYSQSLNDAIHQAYNKNVLIVAAAGNTDPSVDGNNTDITKSYPVCYDGTNGENMIIGVASVGKNLTKSLFSNYGGCVDIVAPGEDFFSTQVFQATVPGFTDYYDGYWSGTSLSAPLVSGVLASIKALRPDLSATQIRDFVLQNADDIDKYNPAFAGKLGHGLLDASRALDAAIGTVVAPVKKPGAAEYVVVGLGYGSFPQIKVMRTDGTVFKQFFAFSPYFKGPINVAAGDVVGNGEQDVVTAAGVGGGPHIRVFNVNGQLVSQFFAYDQKFRGGVNIAVADLYGDGSSEIITAPGKGAKPEIRIFDYQGHLLNKFMAYDSTFLGGVKIAAGDVNHDGKAEIVAGAGAGGGPHVRVFMSDGTLLTQFFAYNQNFRGGINVAVGDVHGDGQAEVVASVENNSLPTVRIFTYNGILLQNFFAYDPSFLGGVNLAVGDVDNDGVGEVIAAPRTNNYSDVRIFDRFGTLKFSFPAHNQTYRGSVQVALIQY